MSTSTARRSHPPSDEHCLRMKDLCEATGLERQAIHFYIQQGLLPPGKKTGRNMAWYKQAHVERLLLIRRLQQERFLPLKAIKALLDGRDEDLTVEQQRFLGNVKARLAPEMLDARQQWTEASEVLSRSGVEAADLDEAIDIGLVATREDDAGAMLLAQADVWLVELFGQMRSIGFTRERGFSVRDVLFYEEAMTKLFREEMQLLSRRLAHLPPEEVAAMIEKALPIIHTFLTRYHTNRVKDFFSSL